MNDRREAARSKERYWKDHIVRWERGSRTQREYCQRHDLAVSTFQLWRRRLAHGEATAQCVDIVPVVQAPRISLFPPPVTLAVVLDGGRHRIEIGDGVRVETLRVVLEALEARR